MIKTFILYHLIALVLGFFLDLLIGDPHWIYHPVRFIGLIISLLEKIFIGRDAGKEKSEDGIERNESDTNGGRSESEKNREKLESDRDKGSNKTKIFYGVLTVIIVLFLTLFITSLLIVGSYMLNDYLGLVVETLMTYFILATKSLEYESMKVYKALQTGTLDDARKAVSMIVGRDTENLSEEGVVKAAVETVAENTSDGVIAPMIFTGIGGPILGFLYKAVNTMDSMIGYKNDKYSTEED